MTPIECRVGGVFVAVTGQCTSPVVLLDLDGDDRRLPIYIGLWEAMSISNAIQKEIPPRPLTHDLFAEFLRLFKIEVVSLTVDSLEEGVFYGKLSLRGPGREEVMDCRPSDGIAIAVRSGAAILLEPAVAETCAVRREELPDLVDLPTYLSR
jgi:bifunctional DNase/RNase